MACKWPETLCVTFYVLWVEISFSNDDYHSHFFSCFVVVIVVDFVDLWGPNFFSCIELQSFSFLPFDNFVHIQYPLLVWYPFICVSITIRFQRWQFQTRQITILLLTSTFCVCVCVFVPFQTQYPLKIAKETVYEKAKKIIASFLIFFGIIFLWSSFLCAILHYVLYTYT